jgi:hypothetical protein
MRTLVLLAALAMTVLGGCGDDRSSSPADMATPAPLIDMAPYPHECGCVCAGSCSD